MSNLLYRCSLSENIHTSNLGEPRSALLRLYGPAHSDTHVQLEVFRKLADEKLGPKLYATFEGGRLEEYLPSTALSWIDMTNDNVSSVIASKIASIHKLELGCLDRKPDWLLNMYRIHYDFLINARQSPIIFDEFVSNSTKVLASEMMNIDFNLEIEYLSSLFQQSRAPLVFSHNDLHQNNVIMLTKSDNQDQTLSDRIVLIDFEYCSYNYRTFDIANHLNEWCFDYNGDQYPHFTASKERFPSEQKQRQFLRNYIECFESDNCDQSFANRTREIGDPGNKLGTSDKNNIINDKIEQLLEEMQPSLMASNLLWTLWAIKSACTSKIKFGYWVSWHCDMIETLVSIWTIKID